MTSPARKKRHQYRRKRGARARDEDTNKISRMYMMFILFITTVNLSTDQVKMLFGGNKREEMPRTRKDLEKDIFLPLGDVYFRRSYRMKKESFYKLHTILAPLLTQHFFSRAPMRSL